MGNYGFVVIFIVDVETAVILTIVNRIDLEVLICELEIVIILYVESHNYYSHMFMHVNVVRSVGGGIRLHVVIMQAKDVFNPTTENL